MIYGKVKNRKLRKIARKLPDPLYAWVTNKLNDKEMRKICWAMVKYFKSIGFYKSRYDYDKKDKIRIEGKKAYLFLNRLDLKQLSSKQLINLKKSINGK